MEHAHGMHEMAASGFDYTLAFLAGFLGSGHCLGMCGALVSGYFMQLGGHKSYLPHLAYQLTRITVYISIGMLAASFGVVLVSSGDFGKFQSLLQMLIGTVVIVLALGIVGIIPWQGSMKLIPMTLFRKGYATARSKGPVVGAMMAGFLNGLMPCPLTFAMYVEATSAVSIPQGGALLLAFGLGTLPMMLFISLAFTRLGANVRGKMLKAAAVIMVFMGLNTVYKGASFYLDASFKHVSFLDFMLIKLNELLLVIVEWIEFLKMTLEAS